MVATRETRPVAYRRIDSARSPVFMAPHLLLVLGSLIHYPRPLIPEIGSIYASLP